MNILKKAEESKNYELVEHIKVTITEPELIPYFKYFAMDIDDDVAIYVLTKSVRNFMKQEMMELLMFKTLMKI